MTDAARRARDLDGSPAASRASVRSGAPSALAVAVALGLVYVLWGSTTPVTRIAVMSIPPFAMVAIRFGIAGTLLWTWSRLRGTALPRRSEWIGATVTGCLLLVSSNGLSAWVVQYVPSGLASLFFALAPLWMAILAYALYREPLTPMTALGLAIGLAGMFYLFLPSGAQNLPLVPTLVGILTSMTWGFGAVLQRGFAASDLVQMSALQMLVASVVLAAVAVASGEHLAVVDFTPGATAAVLYLVAFGSILGFSSFLWLMNNVPTSLARPMRSSTRSSRSRSASSCFTSDSTGISRPVPRSSRPGWPRWCSAVRRRRRPSRREGSRVSQISNADRYLDLMLKCLTNVIYGDGSIHPADERGRYEAEKRDDGRDWPSVAHTMIGIERLKNVRACVERVLDANVPGDFVETGVWRGGASIMMRAILAARGDRERKVWLADSFRGLPPPDPETYPQDDGDELYTYEELAIPLETVKANFAAYDLLDEQVAFLPGWFRDTLPTAPIERIAVLRLDGDMYESTIVALDALYPRLSSGGFLIVDDFGAIPTCAEAVADYRHEHAITEPMERIDWTGVYWRKA